MAVRHVLLGELTIGVSLPETSIAIASYHSRTKADSQTRFRDPTLYRFMQKNFVLSEANIMAGRV